MLVAGANQLLQPTQSGASVCMKGHDGCTLLVDSKTPMNHMFNKSQENRNSQYTDIL